MSHEPPAIDQGFGPHVPPIAETATAEERELHWMTHVYQADRMPQLTLRAVLMGAVIGIFMSIAHLYTSLKLGWGFGIAITACVVSYVSWNGLRLLSGNRLSKMSILENNCMQSTASAAGYSTGSTVATAVGALLLITGEHLPWEALTGFVFFAAALGVFWAIPMKRQMINVEQLRFPSGIAAAATLRSLYTEGAEAMRKAYALLIALGIGVAVGLFRAPEKALNWIDRFHEATFRIPDLFHFEKIAGHSLPHRQGFGFEPSVLLIGAGMITGLRVSLSMLAGSLVLYLFVAPYLIGLDNAAAAAAVEQGTTYTRDVPLNTTGTVIAITRWSLWGGTSIMVFASLASLALGWKTIARSFRVFRGGAAPGPGAAVEVPMSWLVIGLVPITIGMVLVQWLAFDINMWLGLLAVALSFVISLVCSRATGETDTTPTGAMGKVTQAVFAVVSPGNITHNLISAGATSSSGLAAADLLTDLKSGYLLGANPRKQFWAQFIGVFFGTLATIPGWYLMIPDKAALEAFNPPATNMWKAVALALTEGLDTIPQSARVAILIGAFVGVLLPVAEKLFPKAKPYMPSAMGLGLSWVVVFANSLSFAVGALISWGWARAHRRTADAYNIPIASGLVAGESMLLALIAMLATATKLLAG